MSRFLGAQYARMDAYTPGEQPRDMQYIKLNTNENPYPPAPAVTGLLSSEDTKNLRLYSDPTCAVLKEKLSALYGVKKENIFVGNGSDDILNFLFMAYSREKGVTFADITYGFYSVYAALYGAESAVIPLKEDFSVDYRDYCDAGKMVVIANPNAPTGLSLPRAEMEKIIASNPQSVVVVDEAYVDFGGESCLELIQKYDNLVVVRTFSKSRSMAGARLGYAFASKAIIEDLEKLKYATNPYSINRLTLRLGEKTVEEEAYTQACCKRIVETREKAAKALRDMGFTVLNSDANFLFAAHPSISGRALYERLKESGILVRHFASPRIDRFIRITIGTEEDMVRFVYAIRKIIEGGPNAKV